MKVWTKAEIKDKLASDNNWLIRGLMAIYTFQTETERTSAITVEDNGVGFNGADAEILTNFADHYKLRGFLSPKQIQITRKKMLKYAGQLSNIANGKVNANEPL